MRNGRLWRRAPYLHVDGVLIGQFWRTDELVVLDGAAPVDEAADHALEPDDLDDLVRVDGGALEDLGLAGAQRAAYLALQIHAGRRAARSSHFK